MNQMNFFKSTPVYKEYQILDLISKDKTYTQRDIANRISVSLAMVNSYLDTYEKEGLLERNILSPKNIEYLITKKGIERKRYLNIKYLESARDVYLDAKANITEFLNDVMKRGINKLLLYGAGDVADIMLLVISSEPSIKLEVVGVIDENPKRIGDKIITTPIVGFNSISELNHDAILISSYAHYKVMHQKLKDNHYPEDKILQFFEYK